MNQVTVDCACGWTATFTLGDWDTKALWQLCSHAALEVERHEDEDHDGQVGS